MRKRSLIAVYMMANGRHGTLHIGVTSDLYYRVQQHKTGALGEFTGRYSIRNLVWFEMYASIVEAIAREKALKKYRREWKINLIEAENPTWMDLYPDLLNMEQNRLNLERGRGPDV